MTGFGKDRLVLVLGMVLLAGLLCAGCQAQLPYNAMMSNSTTSWPVTSTASGPITRPPTAAENPADPTSGVFQSGYRQMSSRPDQPGPLTEEGSPAPAPPPGMAPGYPGQMAPPPGYPGQPEAPPGGLPLPRELAMTAHPAYIIEPPDILLIDAIRLVPRPPYRIEPLDVLLISVNPTLPDQPINNNFIVSPEGTVALGFGYGVVRVAGLTLEQAAERIKATLGRILKEPQVAVALVQFRGVQQTRGEHLVSQDGTVTLGTYGSVCVAGLTLCQAKLAIERYLSRFLLNPEISLNVSAYNSKVFYIIFDGGGYGQQIFRLPITGKDTVLDAISQLGGLPAVASKHHIWVARPAPCSKPCYQILPVNWEVLTQAGDTETNYQLFPGDRIYVRADPLIQFDNRLAKLFSPIERIFGIILLGNFTVQSFRNNGGNGNNNGGGFGFFGVGR